MKYLTPIGLLLLFTIAAECRKDMSNLGHVWDMLYGDNGPEFPGNGGQRPPGNRPPFPPGQNKPNRPGRPDEATTETGGVSEVGTETPGESSETPEVGGSPSGEPETTEESEANEGLTTEGPVIGGTEETDAVDGESTEENLEETTMAPNVGVTPGGEEENTEEEVSEGLTTEGIVSGETEESEPASSEGHEDNLIETTMAPIVGVSPGDELTTTEENEASESLTTEGIVIDGTEESNSEMTTEEEMIYTTLAPEIGASPGTEIEWTEEESTNSEVPEGEVTTEESVVGVTGETEVSSSEEEGENEVSTENPNEESTENIEFSTTENFPSTHYPVIPPRPGVGIGSNLMQLWLKLWRYLGDQFEETSQGIQNTLSKIPMPLNN